MQHEKIETILAFDYGLKRVGVAIGNTLTHSARGLTVIAAQGDQRWQRVAELIKEWQPQALVVGVPFHPDGAEHENTRLSRKFGRQLYGRFQLAVYEVDERYTTTSAYSAGANEQTVDAVSAAIILEQYLHNHI